MRYLIPALFILTALTGCFKFGKEEREKGEPFYYRFSDSDKRNIPLFRKGDTVRYSTQGGPVCAFAVVSIDSGIHKRHIHYPGTRNVGADFYYDELGINFRTLPDDSAFHIVYRRMPIGEAAQTDYDLEFASRMEVAFWDFPYWNGQMTPTMSGAYFALQSSTKTTLDIGTRHYDNVTKIESNRPDSTGPNKRVNVLYYADGVGIIGYDDIRLGPWRLR
jgi:hypothetical protein